MRLAILAILLALTSSASAEQRTRGFAGGDVLLGVDVFMHGSVGLEGGLQLGTLPLWARASADAGGAFDFEGDGSFRRAMIGLEMLQCSSPWVCLMLDASVGGQRS